MAASLLSRCVCQRTRSFFTKVSRCSAARLCTNATDGNQENSDLLKSQKSETTSESTHGERALAGFAKALEKARVEVVTEDDVADDTETEHTTFAAMLRHSKLMQLGDYTGRMVVGTVIEVVGDDLYVDFGGKFHCVCPRPKLNSDRYHRGVKVKLRLNDLEMSSSFLGSDKHVTLLEADATLIGLRRQPAKSSSLW
ncbi:hypothetical protein V1264_009436 [Littorina saxatilis]|uniref:Mitochondrial ribosomal protein S28 n=1 Tax=Littorina saxatilis TaxID=31220 RepID=A0AAN9ARE5_9CAEN